MATKDVLVRFPKSIEVFMPKLDGVHPIVASDINDMVAVLNRLQDTLGYGPSDVGAFAGTNGPKGANASVAERLDVFLAEDGNLADVVAVTVETTVGYLSELGGFSGYIPFGRNLSGTDYRVLIQCFSDETEDEHPQVGVHACTWIESKRLGGLTLVGRTPSGAIERNSEARVTICVLAFGPSSTA